MTDIRSEHQRRISEAMKRYWRKRKVAYCWRTDSYASWHFALRMKSLAIGSRRPATLFELYYVEGMGGIP